MLAVNFKKIKRGQALIELVLVTGLLSLILVALVSLTVVSLSTIQKTRLRTRATSIAQQGLENFRARRDQLAWDDFGEQCTADPITMANMSNPGLKYTLSATCSEISPTSINTKVVVGWTFGGKSSNVELGTTLNQPNNAIYR